MEIVFDEIKRQSNKLKHGYDFAELDESFFASARILPARSRRLMAVGWLGATIVAVVFRPLGDQGLSVVSMRPASRKERSAL